MEKRNIKLVYCIGGTYNSGGMERVLSNKANWLSSHGYEITIITTEQRGRNAFFPLNPNIQQIDLGINYEESKGIAAKLFSYPFKLLKHKSILSKHLRSIRPDIVVSLFDNGSSIIPKINDGSKKILEVHFSRFKRKQYERKGLLGIIDRILSKQDLKTAKSYDHFVVLTNEDKGYWGMDKNISVIPNALNNTFRNIDLKETERTNKIIAVGRLAHQKHFSELIHIFSAIHDKAPDWGLEIIGNGPDKDRLQKLIDGLGLKSKVTLSPVTSTIQEKYLTAGIYAMTSRYEGLPMVLLEAQACGLPIISYDCKCGPKDIINDGIDGYIIPMGDRQLFADKLLELIKDQELRLRMGNAAVVSSKRFDEERIMRLWTSLFNKILYE
ncbi:MULTISPECIES: glycosyltransferase family 4 protein [environmental samples]|uniref:glycosyltransferase family 4 protein n=1 Tax=environmental samples TaxID=134245 RepID=UPI00033AEB29|nr:MULTISPECIES: glycosyltransferase family 4 protein [environmental samples]CCY09910.1 glycoside transferase family 4 [Porphyromonas sp. CAG:1061]